MSSSEGLLNVEPKNSQPILYHVVDSMLTAILFFVIYNIMVRTTFDLQVVSPMKINPAISASIAFCLLELIVILVTKIFLKSAKDGAGSHFGIGFMCFLISILFFIIESSTFYNQEPYDLDDYYYHQEKIKQNNYQVVIEVLLRVIALFTLLIMVLKK